MIEEAVYAGVDVARSALDVAVTESGEVWQFVNDDEGVSQAIHYIASVKPAGSILEANGLSGRIDQLEKNLHPAVYPMSPAGSKDSTHHKPLQGGAV